MQSLRMQRIATSWETAYFVKNFDNTISKFYFVHVMNRFSCSMVHIMSWQRILTDSGLEVLQREIGLRTN